jgi:hypothetical protein
MPRFSTRNGRRPGEGNSMQTNCPRARFSNHHVGSRELFRSPSCPRFPPLIQTTTLAASTSFKEVTRKRPANTNKSAGDLLPSPSIKDPILPSRSLGNSTSRTISQLLSALSGMFISSTCCDGTEEVNENCEVINCEYEEEMEDNHKMEAGDNNEQHKSSSFSSDLLLDMSNISLSTTRKTLISRQMRRWYRGSPDERQDRPQSMPRHGTQVPYSTWLKLRRMGIDLTYAEVTRAEVAQWYSRPSYFRVGKEQIPRPGSTNLRFCWTYRE